MSVNNQLKISDESIQVRLLEWKKFDLFLLEQIDSLVARMEKINEILASHVGHLLKERVSIDVSRAAIGDLFKISMQARDFEGMQKLVESLGKSSSIDFEVKSLVGMVHYNLLLCRRFAAFRNAIQMLDVLNVNPNDAEKQRENLLRYGLDLQYIWKICHSQCRTLAEKEMFEKAISSSLASKVS